ncbi:MAG: glycerol-3-phosphate 1-O-acyltransferase PlsY [Coriobacteriales bacterium]|jgi:glycerol-3-phosphate acyltransferase PlsY|nr:glycerol-3-phosphate 1-O-acyltransferase PlsY [Coriobacteriales bacterium]
MMSAILLLTTLVIAFLLGSVPWGIIIARLFYKTDIRAHGSGNIGTTNAMRTLGKRGGGSVFVLDFGKGLLAGFLGWLIFTYLVPLDDTLFHQSDFLAAAFAGCTLGHVFSPWLKFKGGKGIAVAVGCLFFTFGWLGTLIELGIFIVLVLLTRYVSIGSLAAAFACPFIGLWLLWGDWVAVAFCTLTSLVIIWAHRGNIKRLAEGNEHRIGKRKAE